MYPQDLMPVIAIILSAPLPGMWGNMESSEITYDDFLFATELSDFILSVLNKAFDDKNMLYNFDHVGAPGHECQSVHRDMHKIPVDRGALTVFYAENHDLDANYGTNTLIILGNRTGLREPWNPAPIDLRRGDLLVMSSHLIQPCPFRFLPNCGAKWDSSVWPTSWSRMSLHRASMFHVGHPRSRHMCP